MAYMRFLLILMVIFCFSGPARAEKFTLAYGAYSGGFQALDIALDFNLTASTYAVTMNAKPYGVLGSILPWGGNYQTTGTIRKNLMVPATHLKTSLWREDKDQYSFAYKNGVLVKMERLEIDNGRKSVSSVVPENTLHRGSIDIMTAAMRMMAAVTPQRGCSGEQIVFDGKRRFALQFTDKGTEHLEPSRWNSFKGEAHICQVEMKPLLGYSGKPKGYYKIQEEARAKGQLPRIWLAQLWKGGPFVPVRMMVKYGYGAMLVHLQGVKR